MTVTRRFAQVDVFTAVPLMGNPVAVVLDGEGLTTEQMQAMAAWTNLSETTFVLPPSQAGADYRVRIFTPKAELPFAGHPTLGTAHAVIEVGIAAPKDGRLVQECAVGLVELTVGADRLSFRLPRYALTELSDPEATAWINAPVRGMAQAVDVGPVWLVAEVDGVSALEHLAHDEARLAAYYVPKGWTGATLFAAEGDRVVVRSFAPGDGIPEDPVCGSGNGAAAAFRLNARQVGDGDSYRASQGRQVGRDGWIDIRFEGSSIHVGGQCVTCITGTVTI
ncbi:PhzF family phenazine biosynthesis protein [Novosphingobium ginsenosidimutans]|uniref:PhzF family phenazine biosynthesis protein n=1 Tax=Novosphingobium ginsenosidimutans TaxID=1176536 RepID=A0A5B8SAQ3_9SPHN|nr:PhzF family phenazine biosynthesis protein [Novosphingobium ginsenosidimutans]QEA17265.1 PhzF family phenazine biosynthesis protein [Novosphingobium ginsenosidimutans]